MSTLPEYLRDLPGDPVWMVVREGIDEPVTFGPFKTREEADMFVRSPWGGFVYDDRINRASRCGPWLP